MAEKSRLAFRLRLAALPALVIVALLIAWKLGYFELDRRQQLLDTVQGLRVRRGIQIWYVLVHAIVITFCVPATIATILGGAIFGSWMGALLAWLASLIATVLSYGLARRVARKPIQRLFGEHRLLRELKANDGVPALFRLRILPVAPFAVLGYLAGVAAVSVRRLLAATALGVLPSAIAYSYVGAELMTGLTSPNDASKRAFWIAGIVTVVMLLVSVVPAIVRRLRD